MKKRKKLGPSWQLFVWKTGYILQEFFTGKRKKVHSLYNETLDKLFNNREKYQLKASECDAKIQNIIREILYK